MNRRALLFAVAAAAPLWSAGCAGPGGEGPSRPDAADTPDGSRSDVGGGASDTPDGSRSDVGGGASDTGAETDAGPVLEPLIADPVERCRARAALPFDNAVAEGEAGYDGMCRFLFDTFGTETLDSWPPAEFMVRLQHEEPEVFGEQFAAFGFVPDPESELPFGLVRGTDDTDRVHETCAVCHTARLPDGRTWLGTPNAELRWGAFRLAVNERWVAAGNEPLVDELMKEKLQGLGPGRARAESADFPDLVPADFPVYYDLAERTAFNHLGTGRDVWTESHFAVFAFGAGRPNAEEAEVPFPPDEDMQELVDFVGAIAPPAGPAQDGGDVDRGRRVFEDNGCNGCHHPNEPGEDGVIPVDLSDDPRDRFPGDDPDWPDGSVATSPAHAAINDEVAGDEEQVTQFLEFIFEHGLSVRQSEGYRTPNLRGVWESAPFFHNGSVPTLEDVLKPPAERPVTWTHGEFEVDTTVSGYGNGGHAFGVDLPETEKEELLAYLRSL